MLGIHLNKTNIKLNKEPSLLHHESHFDLTPSYGT